MDLSIIATVQLVAFFYGASVVYTERPAFIAFAKKDFTVVSAAETAELEMDKMDKSKVTLNKFGPTYIYATLPEDPAVAAQIIYEIFNGGKDFSHRPEYYRDFESNIEKNFSDSIDLSAYSDKYEQHKPAINNFLSAHNKTLADIAAFPLNGKHHNMILVIDKASKKVLGAIDVNPWLPLGNNGKTSNSKELNISPSI